MAKTTQQTKTTTKQPAKQQQTAAKGGSSSGGKQGGAATGLDPAIAKRLKQMNERWAASREESNKPGFAEGTTLSDGRHVTRLSGARIVMAKDSPCVVWEFTAIQGDEIGEKAVRFSNFGKDEQIIYLQRDMRKMGAAVDEFDAEQLPAILKQLLEEAPALRITVRTNGEYRNVYIDKLLNVDELEDTDSSTGDAGDSTGDEPGDDAGDDTAGDDAGDDAGEADDQGEDSGEADASEGDDDAELPPEPGDSVAVIYNGKKVKGKVKSYNAAKGIAMVEIPKVGVKPFKKELLTALAA